MQNLISLTIFLASFFFHINGGNLDCFYISPEIKIKNDQKIVFIVTARNGIIIRGNPNLESKRIGLIPFGSKINISEKTNERLKFDYAWFYQLQTAQF